jgi:chorismate mutase
MPLRHLFPLIATLGLLAGCVTTPKTISVSPAETSLTELMIARLEIGREVAWIKFLNHLPIRDPQREADLVSQMTSQGRSLGLDPKTVQTFFQAQIDASCRLQEESIRYWARGGTLPARAPRDLKRDIRPELDKIGSAILRELARVEHEKTNTGFKSYAYTALRQREFSWKVARLATSPLN